MNDIQKYSLASNKHLGYAIGLGHGGWDMQHRRYCDQAYEMLLKGGDSSRCSRGSCPRSVGGAFLVRARVTGTVDSSSWRRRRGKHVPLRALTCNAAVAAVQLAPKTEPAMSGASSTGTVSAPPPGLSSLDPRVPTASASSGTPPFFLVLSHPRGFPSSRPPCVLPPVPSRPVPNLRAAFHGIRTA